MLGEFGDRRGVMARSKRQNNNGNNNGNNNNNNNNDKNNNNGQPDTSAFNIVNGRIFTPGLGIILAVSAKHCLGMSGALIAAASTFHTHGR